MSELKRELQEFSRTANELKAVWNKMSELDRKESLKDYPFAEDFPKVANDIKKWNDAVHDL